MRPPLSIHHVAAIGESVARAADLAGAYRTAASETARVFQTVVSIYGQTEGKWTLVASTVERLVPLRPDASAAFDRVSRGEAPVRFGGVDNDVWTAVSLPVPVGQPLAVLLGGDWTGRTVALGLWTTVTALAIDVVRERAARADSERVILQAYATARRLSRPASVEAVGQRIVEHVARLLNAERISLAIYRPAEDCLVVEAASGAASAEVRDIRIQPGSWVIGHVFSTGRPLFVRDVRDVHGMARPQQPYRSYSFAAVPLFAGLQKVGVLTATDKKDGSPLTRQDVIALRTYGAVAAMAIVAARSQDEMGRLAHAATVDSLTGLLNRPYLDARLHQEVERARRSANSLAVLMADVDDFKVINDTYGHQIGDAVLRAVGNVMRSAVRVFDVCARYGGDEFAILMPNSDAASAAACGERIRRRLAGYRSDQDSAEPLPPLTMSIGVAVIAPGDSPADLIMRADKCLYEAKADGKNRVRVHASIPNGRSSSFRTADDEQEPI